MQECVKPIKVEKITGKGSSAIKIQEDGSYIEIDKVTAQTDTYSPVSSFIQVSGTETKLEKAKITLNDCLACR